MAKTIIIGEAELTIGFEGLRPVGAAPGGTLLKVAAELARRGHEVAFASEVGNDVVGQLIVDSLDAAGVDTRSVERSVSMTTPAAMTFGGAPTVRYENREGDSDGFDIVWPDVERGETTVVFGGYFAVNPRVRTRLMQLLGYMADRKCRIIYVPGFDPSRVTRITRVMPMIFENLEIAGSVVTLTSDIENIFGKSDAAAAFRDHLDFYVDRYVNINPDGSGDLLEIGGRQRSLTFDPAGGECAMIADAITTLTTR